MATPKWLSALSGKLASSADGSVDNLRQGNRCDHLFEVRIWCSRQSTIRNFELAVAPAPAAGVQMTAPS
jgi:hypothetical protein